MVSALCASVVLIGCGGSKRPACRTPAPIVLTPSPVATLRNLIELVPCPATGRVVYGAMDNLGNQLGGLDPIADPAGGYLGVYHTPIGSPPGATSDGFQISIAHSAGLVDWRRVAVLDPVGASNPTLRAVPGDPGYLLAYEKALGPHGPHVIRVRYYGSLASLLAGLLTAQVDLPLRFSRFSNGTPSFYSIQWRGGLSRSIIELGFHYETAIGLGPGRDREATGTLRGFSQWTASRGTQINDQLDLHGFTGAHGDRRQFSFNRKLWRVYESSTTLRGFDTWHVLLYDVSSQQLLPLTIYTLTGAFSTSFGNPRVTVLPAPHGSGQALVVTMFIFGRGPALKHPGELVYYQPI
jgi:hypothetical protein